MEKNNSKERILIIAPVGRDAQALDDRPPRDDETIVPSYLDYHTGIGALEHEPYYWAGWSDLIPAPSASQSAGPAPLPTSAPW